MAVKPVHRDPRLRRMLPEEPSIEEELEEEAEPSVMDLFAKWTSHKIKGGKKKRFAEIE